MLIVLKIIFFSFGSYVVCCGYSKDPSHQDSIYQKVTQIPHAVLSVLDYEGRKSHDWQFNPLYTGNS